MDNLPPHVVVSGGRFSQPAYLFELVCSRKNSPHRQALTGSASESERGEVMQILRMPEVKRRRGHRSDASIYNEIRDGLFTTGVAIGQRAKGWPDYECDAINSARIAGCSDAEIRTLVNQLHQLRVEGFAQFAAQPSFAGLYAK